MDAGRTLGILALGALLHGSAHGAAWQVTWDGADEIAVFSGEKCELHARVVNGGADAGVKRLEGRLWQHSSATKMPAAQTEAWGEVRLEAGASLVKNVPIHIPELRTAARFSVQVREENGAMLGELRLVAFPRGWFVAQLAGLPKPLAVYDPRDRVAAHLRKLETPFTALDGTAEVRGRIVLAVAGDAAGAKEIAASLADRGAAAVVTLIDEPAEPDEGKKRAFDRVEDYRGLPESALAQWRFVNLLKPAIRAKESAERSNLPR